MLPTEFPANIRFHDYEGGINFRDIGGYPAAGGRHVRHGLIFRSGMMSQLAEREYAALRGLGIRSVCDLRSRDERESHPSHWLIDSAIEVSERQDEEGVGDLTKFYQSIQDEPGKAREVMLSSYRTMPYTLADAYRNMFRRLLDGKVPMVFHCAGGKDRTGIAAALLLSALGVPRELVLRDYQATDRAHERLFEVMRRQVQGMVDIDSDRDTWFPLIVCDPAYLEQSFDEFEKRDGGVEGFLDRQLGVDAAAIERLRELYTE